jgi:pimeloyl-ACP methyl ester carboxylesterase
MNSQIFPKPTLRPGFAYCDGIVWITKPNGSQIPCAYLPNTEGSNKIVIYFHGNGEDIGWAYEFCEALRDGLKVHVLAVEYPGYSIYSGAKPNPDQICQDSLTVYDYLTQELKVQPNQIIIFGRSIGSGAATYLASHRLSCALFLVSPIDTLKSAAKNIAAGVVGSFLGGVVAKFVPDKFNNIEEIKKVQCPCFFIHGKNDNVVSYQSSVLLKEQCKAHIAVHKTS